MTDRYSEVYDLTALVLGMTAGALGHAIPNVLDGAALVSVPGDDLTTIRAFDVVLQDGWRIRFRPEIHPPAEDWSKV